MVDVLSNRFTDMLRVVDTCIKLNEDRAQMKMPEASERMGFDNLTKYFFDGSTGNDGQKEVVKTVSL